ncbi:MAG: KEOPS complex subunit Cgi121 [Thermoplasmata archaeon]
MKCTVVGARGSTGPIEDFMNRLQAEADKLALEAQAFNADMVFGKDHILSAVDHARRAFERGTNVASNFMMEVLVYASGERQISAALEKMGLKEGEGGMVVLAVGGGDAEALLQRLGLERDDSLAEGRLEMLRDFGITKEEIDTVPSDRVFDLVLERVALVDVLK